jgi:hypothetical protein
MCSKVHALSTRLLTELLPDTSILLEGLSRRRSTRTNRRLELKVLCWCSSERIGQTVLA